MRVKCHAFPQVIPEAQTLGNPGVIATNGTQLVWSLSKQTCKITESMWLNGQPDRSVDSRVGGESVVASQARMLGAIPEDSEKVFGDYRHRRLTGSACWLMSPNLAGWDPLGGPSMEMEAPLRARHTCPSRCGHTAGKLTGAAEQLRTSLSSTCSVCSASGSFLLLTHRTILYEARVPGNPAHA